MYGRDNKILSHSILHTIPTLSYFDKKFSSLPLNRRGRAPDATIDTKLNKTVHVGANDVNSLLKELEYFKTIAFVPPYNKQ